MMKRITLITILIAVLCLTRNSVSAGKITTGDLKNLIDRVLPTSATASSEATTTTTLHEPPAAIPGSEPVPPTPPAESSAVGGRHVYSANMGIDQIKKIGILSTAGLTEGLEEYGFSWHGKERDTAKQVAGWTKLIDQGWLEYQANGIAKSQEFYVYLLASADEPEYINGPGRPGPNGYLEPTKNYLDDRLSRIRERVATAETISGLGDYSILLDLKDGAVMLCTLRGPFIFSVTAQVICKPALWPEWAIGREFSAAQASQEIIAPQTIDDRVPVWQNTRATGAIDLMRAFLIDFDEWYNTPIGKGDGPKGYYWSDVRPYLPGQEELPKELAVCLSPETGAISDCTVRYQNTGVSGETYLVNITATTPSPADSQARMDGTLLGLAQTLSADPADAAGSRPIKIKGVDFAGRRVYLNRGNNDRVVFRCENIVVRIAGFNNDTEPDPLPLTEKLARLIANKIVAAGRK